MPSLPVDGSNHGGGEASARPAGRSCLDLATLEEIAAGRTLATAEQMHLDSCEGCRDSLRTVAANLEMQTRLRGVLSTTPPLSTDSLAVAPDLVPGYRLIEEISRGSQGIVYKAVQERTKRVVAMKMLLGGSLATERQRARFEREVEIVAGLNHPGIVTIYDGTPVRGGRFAYAMELVDQGLPLDEWAKGVSGGSKTSIRKKLTVFVRICDAVHHAHQHAVIHRDLKPGNVLVDRTGQPHVLDFGIAKALEETSGGAVRTLTEEFAGTLAYASPEQVAPVVEPLDVRTDVYSLGVILFEMLTGAFPYDVTGPVSAVVQHVLAAKPARASSLVEGISTDLDTVVQKALHKDRHRRYQSAEALSADVSHLLAGEAIDARRDSTWYVMRKQAKRHRMLLTALTVVMASVLVSAGVAARSYLRARSAQSRIAQESERAAAEQSINQAIGVILDELIPPGDASFNDSKTSRARQVIDALAGRLDGGLYVRSPRTEAAVRTLLGGIYARRGIQREAEIQYGIGLAIADQSLGESHAQTRLLRNRLARVLSDRRKHDAARAILRALNPDQPGTGFDTVAEQVRALTTLGHIQYNVGDAASAELTLQEALSLTDNAEALTNLDRADALEVLSHVQKSRDKRDQALETADKVLAIRFTVLGDANPDIASCLEFIIGILEENHDDAANGFRTVLAGLRPGADRATRAASAYMMGWVQGGVFKRDQFEVASAVVRSGDMILEESPYSPHACLRYYDALTYFKRSVHPVPLQEAVCYGRLSSTLAALGDVQAALDTRRQQRALCLETFRGRAGLTLAAIDLDIATCLARLGHTDEAAHAFDALFSEFGGVLDSKERVPALARYLSVILSGHDQQRIADIRRQINLLVLSPGDDPESAREVRIVQACSDALQGDLQRARPVLEDSLEWLQLNAPSWLNYRDALSRAAEAYRASGDTVMAARLRVVVEQPIALIDGLYDDQIRLFYERRSNAK